MKYLKMKSVRRNEKNKDSKKEIINSIENIMPNKSLVNIETIEKIILAFYPREDDIFFNLIFSSINSISTFFRELEKFYKNIKDFSDEDPENKFYGIQKFTKIPKNGKIIEIIELNKLNTDLIFVLVKEIILTSYEEEKVDKKIL